VFHERGQGVPADPVLALGWQKLAAGKGDALALKKVPELEAKLSPAEIEEAARLAAAWKGGDIKR